MLSGMRLELTCLEVSRANPGRLLWLALLSRTGGSSLHTCMAPHGPDHQTFEKAVEQEEASKPQEIAETLAFMFEVNWIPHVTPYAMDLPSRFVLVSIPLPTPPIKVSVPIQLFGDLATIFATCASSTHLLCEISPASSVSCRDLDYNTCWQDLRCHFTGSLVDDAQSKGMTSCAG